MKAERIDHVSIFVKDLDKAMRFFGELFETEFIEPFPIESIDIMDTIAPLGIDICAPLTPDGVSSKVLAHRGQGLSMISFKVPNLDEAVEEMKSRGIRQLVRDRTGAADWAMFDPRDTFGVMIELIEYKAFTMGMPPLP